MGHVRMPEDSALEETLRQMGAARIASGYKYAFNRLFRVGTRHNVVTAGGRDVSESAAVANGSPGKPLDTDVALIMEDDMSIRWGCFLGSHELSY